MNKRPNESDYAELAVAVYVEELAVDRRVLFVGDPASGAPERLAQVARSVDVVSPRARARGTRRGGRTRTRRWPSADDAGRWDLVLVPDLSQAGLADDGKLSEAGRWLDEGGVLVAGTSSDGDESLGYERFFDLLQEAFDAVRMVGQAPFNGYSVVDFAPAGELEVTFDGTLLRDRSTQAQRYLALCSTRDISLDPYAVVQVPSVVGAPARPKDEQGGDDRAAEAEQRAAQLTERLREQQDALDAANVHAEEIERELETAQGHLKTAQGDLKTAQGDLKTTERELKGARDGVRAAENRARDASDAERKLSQRIGELEQALAGAKESGAKETGGTDAEYARLETALRECGRELTDARLELERRGTLVRDLVEELRESREAPAQPRASFRPTDPAPPAAPDDAVARAVSAEAEKAQLNFRLDEVRGELMVAERKAASELEELRRMEAALRGTVRGLNARLAEVTELYQQAQARLTLLEDDRRTAGSRTQELERQLSLVRERLEFEIARAHTKAQAEPDGDTVQMVSPVASTDISGLANANAEREGKLMGQLIRAREEAADLALQVRQARMETELAKQSASELEERITGMVRGYQVRMAEVSDELDRVGSEAERALIAEGELKAKLEAAQRAEATLSGEVEGLKLRLADREAAVAELSANRPTATDPTVSTAEVARLEAELTKLRAELAARDEAAQAEPEPAEPEPVDDPTTPLRQRIESQAGLVARLQTQLAQALDARRGLERALDDARARVDEQVDAVESAKVAADVHVGQSAREVDELREKLDEAEANRRRAEAALEDSKAILEKLVRDLDAGAAEGESSGGGDLRVLRERLAKHEAEAADRELLLRSMTAQLQERDDRLRALERVNDGEGADEDSSALRARLFEMEERVGRLSEELEHEREARRRLERG